LTTDQGPDEPSVPYSAPPPLSALSELLRLLAANAGSASEPGGDAASQAARLVYGPLVQLVGQLMLAWAASGLRSWARTAEILGTALPRVVDALTESAAGTDGDPDARVRRLDELRASFREMAELPGREAQRLQAELDRLLFSGGTGPNPRTGADGDTPWRRWEAKP